MVLAGRYDRALCPRPQRQFTEAVFALAREITGQ